MAVTVTESGNLILMQGTKQEVLDELASREQYQMSSFGFDYLGTCYALIISLG